MLDILAALRKKIVVGVVGGSDFVKQKEQLGNQGELLHLEVELMTHRGSTGLGGLLLL